MSKRGVKQTILKTIAVEKGIDAAIIEAVNHISSLEDYIVTLKKNGAGEAENAKLKEVILKIRKHDSGSWMKDCTGGLFHCSDGFEDRCKLGRLLNDLYKVAGL